MGIEAVIDNLPRTKVLFGIVIVGVIILIIDMIINGFRGTSINTSLTQIFGLMLIIGGSFLATYLKTTCKE